MRKPDQHLIAEVQKLANGRYTHEAANLIAGYTGCFELAEASEAALRKFIAARRQEALKFNPPLIRR